MLSFSCWSVSGEKFRFIVLFSNINRRNNTATIIIPCHYLLNRALFCPLNSQLRLRLWKRLQQSCVSQLQRQNQNSLAGTNETLYKYMIHKKRWQKRWMTCFWFLPAKISHRLCCLALVTTFGASSDYRVPRINGGQGFMTYHAATRGGIEMFCFHFGESIKIQDSRVYWMFIYHVIQFWIPSFIILCIFFYYFIINSEDCVELSPPCILVFNFQHGNGVVLWKWTAPNATWQADWWVNESCSGPDPECYLTQLKSCWPSLCQASYCNVCTGLSAPQPLLSTGRSTAVPADGSTTLNRLLACLVLSA